MNTHEHLIAAKALIADPAKWAKGEYEENGCYCAIGALRQVVGGPYSPDERWLDRFVSSYSHGRFGVTEELNDAGDTSHEDVLAFFDAAIAATSPNGEQAQ